MLPKWYPNVQDPADGNFIEKHIQLISKEHKCVVLFVKGLQKVAEPSRIVEESGQMLVYKHYFQAKKGLLGRMLNAWKYKKEQKALLKEILSEHGQPEICHGHVAGRNIFPAIELKRKSGIPYIISEHWSGYYPESGKMTESERKINRFLLNKADALTSVSRSLADAMKAIGLHQDIEIIPNVIDPIFLKSTIESGLDNAIEIIHISNMAAVKRTAGIIEVVAELAERYEDIHLTIVGDGPNKKKMKALAASKDALRDKYTFTGDIPPEEVLKWLKKASFSVMFSRYETQSIVLMESIAMGIPVVAPAVGGIPEHFSDKGIIFSPNDENTFKASIEDMISKRKEYDAEKLRQYALDNFSEERIMKSFSELYQRLRQHAE